MTMGPSEDSSEGKLSFQGEGGVKEDQDRASWHVLRDQGTGRNPSQQPGHHCPEGEGRGRPRYGMPSNSAGL